MECDKIEIVGTRSAFIKNFFQLANILLSCNQVSNMPIEVYITYLIVFSKKNLSLIFINHQSHCYSEINPERNWDYCETSSDTNDYCGPKQRSYHQRDSYNKGQQYRHDRTTQHISSRNVHDR